MKEKQKQPEEINSRSLSDAERENMKQEFSAYLDMHPVQHTHNVLPGPFTALCMQLQRFSAHAAVGLAVAAVFTISASEFSLPTDSLYAVKTNVNERVLLASTYFSPALYAQAGHAVYARRLEEAEQLLLLEQLTSEAADTMQESLDKQEAVLSRSIERAELAGDSESAATVRSHVASTQAQYDPIIDILELRKTAPDAQVIDDLLEEVLHDRAAILRSNPTKQAFIEIKQEVMEEYANVLLNDLETLNRDIHAQATPDGRDAALRITDEIAALLKASNTARSEAESRISSDPEQALRLLQEATMHAEQALQMITSDSKTDTEGAEKTPTTTAPPATEEHPEQETEVTEDE